MLRPTRQEDRRSHHRRTTAVLTASHATAQQPPLPSSNTTLANYFDGTPPHPSVAFAVRHASFGEAEIDTLLVQRKLVLNGGLICLSSGIMLDGSRTSLSIEHNNEGDDSEDVVVCHHTSATITIEGGLSAGKVVISGLRDGAWVKAAVLPVRLGLSATAVSSTLLVFLQMAGANAGNLHTQALVHEDQMGFDIVLLDGSSKMFCGSDGESIEVHYWTSRIIAGS